MNDSRILQIRNIAMMTFAILGALVMWGNVISLSGTPSVLVHVLLAVNLGALAYFVNRTGLDSLTTTPLPLILIGLLALASIARFIYAMSYGD
ncbi:MAG: hypothetical protein KF841_12030 [Phycisphaerae bacterium]|nr:hypothetical protein [Phycisphaerae bacterium]